MDEQRDEMLRHSLLTAARLIGSRMTGGWVAGSTLADAARDAEGNGVAGDGHACGLLGVLEALGLLEEEAGVHLGVAAGKALRHRRFRLTKKGWALWMGDVPPVPGVWDPRLE